MNHDTKYNAFEEEINKALVAGRGNKSNAVSDKIAALEKKLESARLSNTEVTEIQKQLKQLRLTR